MKNIFLFTLLTYLTACGQDKETITTNKDIYSIGNEIKHYDKEPHYGAYISTNNCSFEILLNGNPIIINKDYSGSGLADSYFPLNGDIVKNGLQTMTIRLYPSFNPDTGTLNPTLMNDSEIQVIVVESLIDKDGNSWGDEKDVKAYKTPQKNFKNEKIATYQGKTFFEDTFTFKANVPYDISTLENAEILLTTDKEELKKLEKEVVAKYNQLRDIYLEGSKDDLANEYYDREKRFAQQFYLSAEEINDRWENDYPFRTDSNLEFFDLKPIENYKMTFSGNGKLVCLEKINNEKSSLWGGYKKKGKDNITTTYITLYLYREKGSTTLKVY